MTGTLFNRGRTTLAGSPRKGPLGWVIRDTGYFGDFCIGYKTEAGALADARERNKGLSGPGAWVQDDGEEVPFL